MMNSEESGVLMVPRLAPTSCVRDLLIPAFIGLSAWVLSIICALVGTANVARVVSKTTRIALRLGWFGKEVTEPRAIPDTPTKERKCNPRFIIHL
jgi:hypothetical protein